MNEFLTDATRDDSLTDDLLPILKLGSTMLGMLFLMIVAMLASSGATYVWAFVFTIIVLAAAYSAHLMQQKGQLRWAGIILSCTFVFLPALTVFIIGVSTDPFIYLSVLGLVIGALMLPMRFVICLSVAVFAMLIAETLLTGANLLASAAPLGVMLLLIIGTTGLSIAARLSIRDTIAWALDTAAKSNRREVLLRATQTDLQEAVYEREQLNQQLYAVNDDLEAARLAAMTAYHTKASFMATMSHELRTPLNLIIGFSTAITEHPEIYDNQPLPQLYYDDVMEIRRSSQHLLSLINDILDLAKIEANRLELHLEVVSLDALLQEMLKAGAGLLIGRSVTLRCEFAPGLPLVRVDEGRIRQVILNLLSNASKFTDQGEMSIGARVKANELVVWVRDSGIGITPEDQQRIFGEFEQVEQEDSKRGNGTGLGLAICRWLIQMHGGEMRVESQIGKGSIFSFTLPIVTVAELEPLEPPVQELPELVIR